MTSQRFKLPWRANKDARLSTSGTLSEALPAAERGDDLWDQAYRRVIHDDPPLGEKYVKALEKSRPSRGLPKHTSKSNHDTYPTEPQYEVLRATVKTQLEAFERKHRKPSKLQDVVTVIDRMKGFVTVAASQEPHAAVAWAALSLLLPALLQPPQQHRNVIAIMNLTADIICRYEAKEKQVRYHAAGKEHELRKRWLDRVEELYRSVLQLQMKAVCQFARSHVHQYARDVFTADDWTAMQKNIQEQDQICEGLKEEIENSATTTDKRDVRVDRISSKLDVAAGAEYYSASGDCGAHRRCHQGTRVELLRSVQEWAEAPDAPPIFWLRGLAGTGKSTIARTVAEQLHNNGHGVASFFFRRNHHDLASVTKLLSTLAFQLAHRDPDYREALGEALSAYPSLGKSAELAKQYQKLILDPLMKRKRSASRVPTLVIVLDALDECENQGNLRSVLDLISKTTNLPELCVRIFLTSREEPDIIAGFSHFPSVFKRELTLQDVAEVQQDIVTYVEYRLRSIQRERQLPAPWPTTEQIRAVARKADGLFIFVETICRYVDVDQREDPRRRLTELCGESQLGVAAAAYAPLDLMYECVLTLSMRGLSPEVCEQYLKEQQYVVGCTVLLFTPLGMGEIERLLFFSNDDKTRAELVLTHLQSVFTISTASDRQVSIIHQSFRDYLVHPKRAGRNPKLWVSEAETHRQLLHCCLKLMTKRLRRDLCNVTFPGASMEEISPDTLNAALPPSLSYACRFWMAHASLADLQIDDVESIYDFLSQHFLYWLEGTSLIGAVANSIRQWAALQSKLEALASPSTKDFLEDGRRFLLTFRNIIERAPLQLYSAALQFSPRKSLVRQRFEREVQYFPYVVTSLPQQWDACQQTLEGHTDGVRSVVFSSDGSQVASASDDCTVRLWDAKTGACQQTLEGHTDSVSSIVFSSDGSQVASASRDRTVRLWDAKTGACQQTLEGHTDWVSSIVFSSDGSQVASASRDRTVRLWDAKTGACQQTLEGHTDSVNSVVFSSDGSQVASASDDRTVRLWDAKTGMAVFVRRCRTFSPLVQLNANGNDICIEGEKIPLSTTSNAHHGVGTENPGGTNEPTTESTLCSPESASTFAMCESREWVLYLGRRYLWIPTIYRGRYTAHGKVLVCGGDSGRMSFIFEHEVDEAPPKQSAVVERAKEYVQDNKDWMLMAFDQPTLCHPFI